MAYLGDRLESYATLSSGETGRTATVTLFRDPNGDEIDADRITQEELGNGQYVLYFLTTTNDVAGHYALEYQFDDSLAEEWIETEWDIETARTIYPSIYTGIEPIQAVNVAPHLRDEDDTHDSQYWKRDEDVPVSDHVHGDLGLIEYIASSSIDVNVVGNDVTHEAIFGTTAGTVAEGDALAAKADTADLADVALSGDYDDLLNIPADFTPATHEHVGSAITGGTVAIARLPTGTSGSTVALGNHTHTTPEAFQIIVSGGGSEIADGIYGDFEVPFTGTLVSAGLFADAVGDFVLDPWKVAPTTTYPPNVSHTIVPSGTKPTLSGQSYVINLDITGWTTAFTQGEIVRINVDSATTIERALFVLRLNRTA